jgi:hypothetical protein
MRFATVSAALVIVISGSLHADESQPIELTIQAREIETPVLKYRLLPSCCDCRGSRLRG